MPDENQSQNPEPSRAPVERSNSLTGSEGASFEPAAPPKEAPSRAPVERSNSLTGSKGASFGPSPEPLHAPRERSNMLTGSMGASFDPIDKKPNKNPLNQDQKNLSKNSGRGNSLGGGRGAGSPSGKGGKAAGAISNTGKSVGNAVSGIGKKITGQGGQGKNESGPSGLPGANKGGAGPAALGGAMGLGASGGGSASGITHEIGGRAMSAMMTIPEAIVMLPIAICFDVTLMVLFILSFFGFGLVLSFLVALLGSFIIGFWTITRSFFRGVIKKAMDNISGAQVSSAPSQGGGGIGKKGVKTGLSVARFLIFSLIKLTPFLGNLVPGFTLTVIFEIVQGEI